MYVQLVTVSASYDDFRNVHMSAIGMQMYTSIMYSLVISSS